MALGHVAPELHRGRERPVDGKERNEGPGDQERIDREASDDARKTSRRNSVVALSERCGVRSGVDRHRQASVLLARLMPPSARSGWLRSGAA